MKRYALLGWLTGIVFLKCLAGESETADVVLGRLSWPEIKDGKALIALAEREIESLRAKGQEIASCDVKHPEFPVIESLVTKDALILFLETHPRTGQVIVVMPGATAAKPGIVPKAVIQVSDTAIPQIKRGLISLERSGGYHPALDIDVRLREMRNLDEAKSSSPRFIELPLPGYPWELFRAGITGDVKLQFVVDPQGRVAQPQMTTTIREFAPPVRDAIARWRFEPGVDLETRLPVDVRMSLVLRFALPEE